MDIDSARLEQPITSVARRDVALLGRSMTVQAALDAIREKGLGEKIVYFYVVDEDGRLVGVIPTRRLLTEPLGKSVDEVKIANVIAIPHTATVLDACEVFAMHKFLAFPVVDDQRRVVGVVDVMMFANEVFDITERGRASDIFELLGLRVSQAQNAGAWRGFHIRFPWLLATIGSGMVCALLTSVYAFTLEKSLALAFFITLVLGLGESVSAQSMTMTIQALRTMRPSLGWYFGALRREAGAGLLLGVAAGLTVGLIVHAWHGSAPMAFSIGLSIALTVVAACFVGLTIPAVLHALRLDPKIAAGPVTLAVADVFTLIFFLGIATLLL